MRQSVSAQACSGMERSLLERALTMYIVMTCASLSARIYSNAETFNAAVAGVEKLLASLQDLCCLGSHLFHPCIKASDPYTQSSVPVNA